MKAALFVLAVTCTASASAQFIPREDLSMCSRPLPPHVTSCIDVATRKIPRLLAICMAELQEVQRRVNEWETCVRQNMEKRHAEERKQLAEEAARQRLSVLQTLEIVVQ